MSMIASMTGYASASAHHGGRVFSLELRSVNHRFLELVFKLPEDIRVCETQIKDRLQTLFVRGKIECRVLTAVTPNGVATPCLSTRGLADWRVLANAARSEFPDARPLAVAEILNWPGVICAPDEDPEGAARTVLALLDEAMAAFRATREREGEKLRALLVGRLDQIEAIVAGLRPLLPTLVEAYRQRILMRLSEVLETRDETRIVQEVALYAQKIDVDEELDRISAHITETRRLLDNGGVAGKRLDFLMQELHREANTLGSKSVALDTTQASMQLKVLIEQMREQVQNIE
jgi:uncharacterized protein (TIGR00255 family)